MLVLKHPEMSKFVPDCLTTTKMDKYAAEKLSYLLRYFRD